MLRAASAELGLGRAVIKLASKAPVTVSGHGFRSHERVAVTVYGVGGPFTKSVSADARGTFTARFARADASCSPVSATAAGSRGSRASFKRVGIPPPCGIPIQP